jgi:carbamate kinase
MRVVVALGGNALLKRGEAMTAQNQLANVKKAAISIAEIVRAGHHVIVTHGNGPQVGLLALQNAAYDPALMSTMDVLVAETEGMLGYLIQQEVRNALPAGRQVVALLTQIVVDADDPAFNKPTKPIGPFYDALKAETLSKQYGWTMVVDGSSFRRAVPSPLPKRIVDFEAITLLVEKGIVTICAGGGGIPVIADKTGNYSGVEAIVDKDHASGLLASQISADALLLLTDVDAVYSGWDTDQRKALNHIKASDLRMYTFAEGSMAPKIKASIDFVMNGGTMAGIGRMEDGLAILDRKAGTVICA